MSQIETTLIRGSCTTPGCFICGGETKFYSYSRGYKVANFQIGQKICSMFQNIGVRLDCWDPDGEWITVMIGACHQHEVYLEILDKLIGDKKVITQEIVDQVKKFSVDKIEITQKTGIETTVCKIQDITNDYYLQLSNSCLICENSSIKYGLVVQCKNDIFKLFKKENVMVKSGIDSRYDLYVLACHKHQNDLEHLNHIIADSKGIINKEIIDKAIHDSKFDISQRRINCEKCNDLFC